MSAADEPPLDYRFTLANERTFLAWIRTSLGLLAGGVAVHTLVQPFRIRGVRTTIALGCIVLAVILATGAYTHWRGVEEAMRARRPLPRTAMVPLLAVGVAVISAVACIGLLRS
jgi:putative membrane protein